MSDEQDLYEKLERELGRRIQQALEDPAVVEIVVNPDGFVRLERLGGVWECTNERFKPARVVALLGTIATLHGTIVNRENPILESTIPGNGSRIEGVLPPCGPSPVFTIRKRSTKRFTLDDYVRDERMSPAICAALKAAVRSRQSILVGGGAGSGKTTLVNALLMEIVAVEPTTRLLVLEDTPELVMPSEWCVPHETARNVDLDDLLRVALRSRPDRIVVGEVRGSEVSALLRAANTGHSGTITTIHCNSAEAALLRIEQLAAIRTQGYVPRSEILEAFQVVVHAHKGPRGPQVHEVIRVLGHDGTNYVRERIAG